MAGPGFESPAVSDAMEHLGLPTGVVDGLTNVPTDILSAIGFARTATVVDSDEANIPGLAEYLDEAQEGDMLVLGWEATSVASVWGGLAATRGCAGLVNAGWIRNLADVSELRLAVWARGATPCSGKGRLAVTNVGAPVTVGGAVINDRDLVIADSTGICVVPGAQWWSVLAYAAQLQDRDEAFRQALSTGAGFSSARREAGTM
ncbi:Regulator of RNase E activity RraA [Amycolatopsis marina]|uniref:Putative 4-hydroxy-4-methyl-2-oxoglutarate aldolase n=1 Tax=Amycolatopsis marina TaxID=490629 RepID=A0A1I1BTS7_9PSEU|nr:RraA family protein [Amycolatopsis marina]SFB53839.1 Regulator of RNase E activity RraA [Amycolatopsis marina]